MDEILTLWEEVIDAEEDVIVHLVKPSPPCTMMECVLGHLIVEQSPQQQRVAGLITILAEDRNGISTEHAAYSLPDFMFARQVLRMADLEVFCRSRLCEVKLGAFPFAFYDGEELPQAAGLTIHLRSNIFDLEDDDHMELMQRPSTRWTRREAPHNGTDLPAPQDRCEHTAFAFNPEAPAFDPAATNVVTLPENLQDLVQHWMRHAFSWDGEAPSTLVKTWFVDHHNHQHWICQQPRQVRLYDEIQHWEATIKNAWREHIDFAAPCVLQVVTPNPPNTDPETTMHVILIQRPYEVFSTIVTTVVDMSQAPGGIVSQVAITMHEHLRLENLLMALGLAGRCLAPGAPMVCHAWYDAHPLQIGQLFPARDGQHILIHMQRRPRFQAVPRGPAFIQIRQSI